MKTLTIAIVILAFMASGVSSTLSQEYAPLIQADTTSVIKFNLDQFDPEALLNESAQFASDVEACFDVVETKLSSRLPKYEATASFKTILSYLQILKERGVKCVYLVFNKRKDAPTSASGFMAVINSHVTSEELDKLYPAGSLFAFDHNGILCIPLRSWGGSARVEEILRDEIFPSDGCVSRPEIEAGMNDVESETACVVGVDLTLGSGAWRRACVARRLKAFVDLLKIGAFDEYYKVEGKIERLIASLSARASAATKLVQYGAWSVDLATERARVVLHANSDDDAIRLRDMLDKDARVELHEFTHTVFNVLSEQVGGKETAEQAQSAVDGLLNAVKLEVNGKAMILTLDKSTIAPAYAKLRATAQTGAKTFHIETASRLTVRLNRLALACHLYRDKHDPRALPPAYTESGQTWKEAGTLEEYLLDETNASGIAMLVDEDGLFVPTHGQSTLPKEVVDGDDGTICFVELSDRLDNRACVTLDEFYEQLRNCPEDRGGYYVAMASGRIEKLNRTTSRARLKALTTKSGRDYYLAADPADARPRLDVLVRACARYNSSESRRGYPPAYTEDGKTWLEAGTLVEFIGSDAPVPGCAMLVDPDGIFEPTPGKSTRIVDAPAHQAIMFVELANPEEIRACITADEFYEQLQNCPEERTGYQVVMRGSYFTTVDKTISRDELQALVSKKVDPDVKKSSR